MGAWATENQKKVEAKKQQEELKQAFFETADLTVTGKIKEAQRKGIDIFTSPLVSSPFKVFIVEQKGF
ncbi:MAG: hypothetical protein WCK96_19305 [Methylococcales bacterium]